MTTTPPKGTPSERRNAAIGNVYDVFIDRDTGRVVPDVGREEVAVWIEGMLMELGRSPKWKMAVRGWAAMVRHEGHDLSWAIIQGGIFTNFQA